MALDDSTDVCKDKQNERNVNKYTYTNMSGSNIYYMHKVRYWPSRRKGMSSYHTESR